MGFATFDFSHYMLTNSFAPCIVNTQLTMTTSSSSINIPQNPIFMFLVWPFIWSTRENNGMFHNLDVPFIVILPFSTTSIIFSKNWYVHFPLQIVVKTILTLVALPCEWLFYRQDIICLLLVVMMMHHFFAYKV